MQRSPHGRRYIAPSSGQLFAPWMFTYHITIMLKIVPINIHRILVSFKVNVTSYIIISLHHLIDGNESDNSQNNASQLKLLYRILNIGILPVTKRGF